MNYLYIVDNCCYYVTKNRQFYKFTFTSSIFKNGRIDKTKAFYKELYHFLQKNKLINILFNKKITVIINPLYNQIDKEMIKEQLEKMNYYSIDINYSMDILNTKTINYLEINRESIFIYFMNKYGEFRYQYIPLDFFQSVKLLTDYIVSILNTNNKPTYVLGENIDNKIILSIEKKYSQKLFVYENPHLYTLMMCSK